MEVIIKARKNSLLDYILVKKLMFYIQNHLLKDIKEDLKINVNKKYETKNFQIYKIQIKNQNYKKYIIKSKNTFSLIKLITDENYTRKDIIQYIRKFLKKDKEEYSKSFEFAYCNPYIRKCYKLGLISKERFFSLIPPTMIIKEIINSKDKEYLKYSFEEIIEILKSQGYIKNKSKFLENKIIPKLKEEWEKAKKELY